MRKRVPQLNRDQVELLEALVRKPRRDAQDEAEYIFRRCSGSVAGMAARLVRSLERMGILCDGQVNWDVVPRYRLNGDDGALQAMESVLAKEPVNVIRCGAWVGFSDYQSFVAALKHLFEANVPGWHNQYDSLIRARVCTVEEFVAAEEREQLPPLRLEMELGFPGTSIGPRSMRILQAAGFVPDQQARVTSLRPVDYLSLLRLVWVRRLDGWQKRRVDLVRQYGICNSIAFEVRLRNWTDRAARRLRAEAEARAVAAQEFNRTLGEMVEMAPGVWIRERYC